MAGQKLWEIMHMKNLTEIMHVSGLWHILNKPQGGFKNIFVLKYKQHKIYLFTIFKYSSVALATFLLCNHHRYLSPEIFFLIN